MLWLRRIVLWLGMGVFNAFENLFSDLLTMAENCYPYSPNLSKGYMEKYFDPEIRTWLEPEVYYFLGDESRRYRQRLIDLMLGHGEQISFWRKRELHRRIKVLEGRISAIRECKPRFRPFQKQPSA